jgi:thymidylate synthase
MNDSTLPASYQTPDTASEEYLGQMHALAVSQSPADAAYFKLGHKILMEGKLKHNRTGVDTIAVAGGMFEYNMADGFPLLTSRQLPFKSTRVELEFFIKGLTDKQWLIDRGCHYWDEWCNPQKVPYGHDEATKSKMRLERDLGKVYGYQWRNFNSQDIDQLKRIVDTLKNNPDDRRMICMAWNPAQLGEQALPPCHYGFQVTVIDGTLNLLWNQRSVDFCCGLPANISSYALLLHLLAKESGLKEGKLVGFLADLHIYVNHLENLKIQLSRIAPSAPTIETKNFTSIFDWTYDQTELKDYKPLGKLQFDVAV